MNDCANEHCLTCSDEVQRGVVLQICEKSGLALVELGGKLQDVDITLVEEVAPGALLLVHGG